MEKIPQNIIDIISIIVDSKIEKKRRNTDQTFQSTVWGINDDGTYQISYKNQMYNVPNALGTKLKKGQSVWVKIPSGIFRKMHIYGDISGYSGGGSSTNNSAKLFLIGATSQTANPTTNSNNKVYIGTDSCLYSNNMRVISEINSTIEPTDQTDGDFWTQNY